MRGLFVFVRRFGGGISIFRRFLSKNIGMTNKKWYNHMVKKYMEKKYAP